MTKTLDLAIVGAGIIGSCVAHYARAAHPEWKIALFDQSLAGSGASQYSATLDFPYGHTPLRRALTKHSRLLYEQLKKELPTLPLKTLPFYGFVQKENGAALLEQFTDQEVKLSPEQLPHIARQVPGLQLQEGTTLLAGAMAQYATRNEIAGKLAYAFADTPSSTLFESMKIKTVIPGEDLFTLRSVDAQTFQSKRVVLATGPWLPQGLAKDLLPENQVRIKKVVAFHIYRQPTQQDPILYFFDDEAFLMPRHEAGYWLFSFRCNQWDVAPEASSLTIEAEDRRKAVTILNKYFPTLVPYCKGGRVFCDGYTENGDPLITTAQGINNLVIAGAGSGSGVRLAPGIAAKAISLLS